MKKNIIIILAAIALVFSFTSCQDKTDPVENYFTYSEASNDMRTIMGNVHYSQAAEEGTTLTLTNYANYVRAIDLIEAADTSIPETATDITVTAVEGTISYIVDRDFQTENGTTTAKVSGLSLSYKYTDADAKERTGKVTADVEYITTVSKDSDSGEGSYVSEIKGLNFNGKTYEDIYVKADVELVGNNEYTRIVDATIGGKEISLTLLNKLSNR